MYLMGQLTDTQDLVEGLKEQIFKELGPRANVDLASDKRNCASFECFPQPVTYGVNSLVPLKALDYLHQLQAVPGYGPMLQSSGSNADARIVMGFGGQEPLNATWPPTLSVSSMSVSNAQQLVAAARTWLTSKPTAHFQPPALALDIPKSTDPGYIGQQAKGRDMLKFYLAPHILNALLSRGLATAVAIEHLKEVLISDVEEMVDILSGFCASVYAVHTHFVQDSTQLGVWLNRVFTELFLVMTEEAKKIPLHSFASYLNHSMLPTAPMNSKRAQDFVLSAMDRVVFRPPSLLRVRDQVAWANAKLFPGAFLSIGDMAFKTNLEEIVVDIFGGEHTADLVSILTSSTTIARFLLSKGVYEDVVPCPFKGMEEPMGVGEGWRIYLATYLSASPIHGPMNLRLFLRDAFTVLAQAAFRSLNPRAHLIKPHPHTTCAQAKHAKRVKLNNMPKMKTMEEKSILYGQFSGPGVFSTLTQQPMQTRPMSCLLPWSDSEHAPMRRNFTENSQRRKNTAASKVRPPPSPSPKTTGKRHRHQTAAPVPATLAPHPAQPPSASRMNIAFLLNA
ncbi:hypothetical protein B0H16DRAFT_1472369 [Mycena metata]|uniref:Uncharacterized protein n=1 Tax=Mycena metata TaxID=1033252 RepID=A0AAD7HN42_9AGAR|nr:hypothetical protein B0H16DRAFT_1472369 [Mycena metata]